MKHVILVLSLLGSAVTGADEAYQSKHVVGFWSRAGGEIVRIDDRFKASTCTLTEEQSSGDTFLLCNDPRGPAYAYQPAKDHFAPDASTSEYLVRRMFGSDFHFRAVEPNPNALRFRHGDRTDEFHRYWPPIGTRILRKVVVE